MHARVQYYRTRTKLFLPKLFPAVGIACKIVRAITRYSTPSRSEELWEFLSCQYKSLVSATSYAFAETAAFALCGSSRSGWKGCHTGRCIIGHNGAS